MSRPQSVSPPTRASNMTTAISNPTTPPTQRKRRRSSRLSGSQRSHGSQSPPFQYRREQYSDEQAQGREEVTEKPATGRHGVHAPAPTANGWTYELEVIQQPQRARACGFGNKDRRPLSPPPIVRLWIRTVTGTVVDPNLVDTRFLIMMVDLWSADRQQERNVVMHPVSAGVTRLESPPPSHYENPMAGPSSRPSTGSRPLTGSSGGMSSWSGGSYRQTSYSSPVPPPVDQAHRSAQQSPHGSASVSGWPTSRPLPPPFSRTTSYTRPQVEHDPEPPRPKTAPSRPANNPPSSSAAGDTTPKAYALPSLASIAEDRPPAALTLPAMHARSQQLRPGSSSHSHGRPKSFQQLEGQSSDYSAGLRPYSSSSSMYDRPSSGWSDARPWSSGVSSNRPSSSGEDLRSPMSAHFGHSIRMTDPSFPPTPGVDPVPSAFPHQGNYVSNTWEENKARYLTSQPAAQYSRVLVGKVTAVCHKLKDEHDELGLYFFAADLGIRTEGTFTLRMVVTDIASMMGQDVMLGAKAPVHAQIYSNPFTVYSAKRFPGVIPTTKMTKDFAAQGVKLSVRETKRAAGGDDGDGEGDEEDD
ncbi:hypothetical protein IAU60_000924 [Kwoniella sp. DSM 27419]